MGKKKKDLSEILKKNLTEEQRTLIDKELEIIKQNKLIGSNRPYLINEIYNSSDLEILQNIKPEENPLISALKTLDELIDHDKRREADGFPRKIRLGKLVKPTKEKNGKVIIVPTTNEGKFYHDDSITEEGEGESTGGAGEGEEGEVIGEQQAQPQPGEGEGQGAGEGQGSDHDITQQAYDLGKILTEKFELPNLREKGKKRSFSKYTYDLTDRNRGFGQVLDKKATLRKIVQTNIVLGNITENQPFSGENLILNPRDQIYRILSKEKDFETQAVVFFVRDYSGSMQGEPTEVISTQHLLIYSWLMFQYQNNVMTRFILHDTDTKEVNDFYTYYSSAVAGGTKVAPAFARVNKIIEEEQLAKDYNIYVFYGTDGDDWDSDGKELTEEIIKMLYSANRLGITVAKNSWTSEEKATTVENTVNNSGLLNEKPKLIRMDSFSASGASEDRIIEGIKKLVSQ
ncbi:MAG: DUF444 family protein [Bacteroidota bacterium]